MLSRFVWDSSFRLHVLRSLTDVVGDCIAGGKRAVKFLEDRRVRSVVWCGLQAHKTSGCAVVWRHEEDSAVHEATTELRTRISTQCRETS